MASRGAFSPTHRRVGSEFGFDRGVVQVRVRCSCGSEQVEPLAKGDRRAQLKDVSCSACGRLGQMQELR